MLKWVTVPLGLTLFLTVAARAQSGVDTFPLSVGTEWVYGDSLHVVRVTGSMKSLPPIQVVDFMGQPRYFILQDDGKVLEWRDGRRRLLYDFGAKAGASWTIEPLGDGFDLLDGTVVTVASLAEPVRTPYGRFPACIHYAMRPRPGLADAGITDVWFAPEVGMVKWSEVWIGGVRSFALTGFSRPGVASRLQAELAVDREVYRPADTVWVRYRVKNLTREPLRLSFRSGHQYDFVLEGPRGKVWQWSDGRVFTQALIAREILPGDSLVVREVIPGERPEGTFVLRGYMVATPDSAGGVTQGETEAQAKFAVEGDGPAQLPDTTAGPGTRRARGDFNEDGTLDLSDFFMFAEGFGTRSGMARYRVVFDLDADGEVGMNDFWIFAGDWGSLR